jgi:hypothetical protein
MYVSFFSVTLVCNVFHYNILQVTLEVHAELHLYVNCLILTKNCHGLTKFSTSSQYQVSWKSIQWVLSHTQTNMAELIHLFQLLDANANLQYWNTALSRKVPWLYTEQTVIGFCLVFLSTTRWWQDSSFKQAMATSIHNPSIRYSWPSHLIQYYRISASEVLSLPHLRISQPEKFSRADNEAILVFGQMS